MTGKYKTFNNRDEQILKENFTIGQAQKWVNMTLKYLWLLDALPDNIDKKDLHVPIDSYIIKIAYRKKGNIQICFGIRKKPKELWSKWDKKQANK